MGKNYIILLITSNFKNIGGFDGTSNVLAGKMYGIPVKGTHAHAFVTSFSGGTELKSSKIFHKVFFIAY